LIQNRRDLSSALRLFPVDSSGRVWISTGIARLVAEIELRVEAGDDNTDLFWAIRKVAGELSTLYTIAERCDWQKQCAEKAWLDHLEWLYFTVCDVEHFIIVLRALFDHVAAVCANCSTRPGQTPKTFHDLVKWTEASDRGTRILGEGLFNLVRDTKWFEDIRVTRDGIVHHGTRTIAIPSSESIAFQILTGRPNNLPAGFLADSNMTDLEMFMGWTLGNLEVMFDQLALIVLGRIGFSQVTGQSSRRGYKVVRDHLCRLEHLLPA
jgi:hypothetical protein